MTDHVALISETPNVSLDELTVVSAAVQKQVSRDFGPAWNLSATVDAFGTIQDVPLGYWHVLVRDDIAIDDAGIHQLDANRQPYALVRWATQWSLAASHEILEMLVDPFGNRLVAGDSPKSDQGRVLFLVEVCDPCQSAACGYAVNGVLVSDFCMPEYFAPTGISGARYCFSGAIKSSRDVLDDGYLSWLCPQTHHLWQLSIEEGMRRIEDVGEQPPDATSMRCAADRPKASLSARAHARAPNPILRFSTTAGHGEVRANKTTDPGAAAIAERLRRQIARRRRPHE